MFEIKPGSDGNVLWKGTVRIKVIKVDPEQAGAVEKTRELNLKQFLQVSIEDYNECCIFPTILLLNLNLIYDCDIESFITHWR